MQGWIVAAVWAAAVVFGLIVVGFLTYELSWKTRRFIADSERLKVLAAELAAISRAVPTRRED